MTKKKLALTLAAVASACLATTAASAGSHADFGFYISPSNGYQRYANGSFASVYNTPDSGSYAECGTNNWGTGTGFCSFVDASGSYLSCYTTDPTMVAVIRSFGDESLFSVSWLEATSQCDYVLKYSSSRIIPKVH